MLHLQRQFVYKGGMKSTVFMFITSWAVAAVDLKSGQSVDLLANPSPSTLRIWIEKDCAACKRYVRVLKTCGQLPGQVDLVLVGPSQWAQVEARSLVEFRNTFWVRSVDDREGFVAFPVSEFQQKRRIGTIACEEIKAWIHL